MNTARLIIGRSANLTKAKPDENRQCQFQEHVLPMVARLAVISARNHLHCPRQ